MNLAERIDADPQAQQCLEVLHEMRHPRSRARWLAAAANAYAAAELRERLRERMGFVR